MPLTDELGELVRARLPEVQARSPRGFTGGYFEAWLSRLAEPQPDLTAAANATNHGLFLLVAQELHRVMLERESSVLQGQPAQWLRRLIGLMHATRATVITFNYDTLIERTVEHLVLSDWVPDSTIVKSFNLVRNIPPGPSRGGFLHDPGARSFRLLKLHGSLDNYWVPGDISGATVQRLPLAGSWGNPSPFDEQERREQLPGREPFIVPPAAAKSSFYNNPISRELWLSAAEALANADRVALIGYSLPPTDLVASGMLSDTLARDGVTVDIVNPYPADIADRVKALGAPKTSIRCIGGSDAVTSYTDQMERRAGQEVPDLLAKEDGSRSLLVGTSPSRVARVVGISRSGGQTRLVTEEVTHASEATRVYHGQTQRVFTVADLREMTESRDAIAVNYPDGTSSTILALAEWNSDIGLGDGRWTVLVPAAITRSGY
ncbi:hypothetical protein ABZU53_11210 [Micromonospora sp. NPDC005194]|uniref:hypothetical protein n=1 Tax=Micromonospora sp. NPDC005194 TaxID=3156870 RepID=UPI0033BC0BAA